MAECRFGELAPGARFHWRQRTWTKTSPLLARADGDPEPVMVPRATRVVTENADDNGDTPAEPRPITRQSLEQLHGELVRLLETLPLEPDILHSTLTKMRERFDSLIHKQRQPERTPPK